ncbi:MAG: hypothetical protein MJB14_02830, partial [Spirochaetes bacterium]|nr:hypothetical protein [Spirochaetota bacterium]
VMIRTKEFSTDDSLESIAYMDNFETVSSFTKAQSLFRLIRNNGYGKPLTSFDLFLFDVPITLGLRIKI